MTHTRTAAFYDTDARQYDSVRFASAAGRRNHAAQVAIVESLIPSPPGLTVEVGSGTGRFTRLLGSRASELMILDIAPQMSAATREAVPHAVPFVGDATQLPFKSGSINTLVCLNVLNHIPEYRAALQEFARVLRPGGHAILNFNNLESPYLLPALLVNRRKRAFRADVFSHWLKWTAFSQALVAAGLRVDRAHGHLPIPSRVPTVLVGLCSRIDAFLRGRARFSPAPILLVQKSEFPGHGTLRG